jgi:hypothetical protein
MYSFLFNQTYITIFVLALLLFFIMYLWRKITILEGNYYLLEKRVNIIKKDSRSELLSKNLEQSDAIMKEVFENGLKSGCDDMENLCNISPEMFQEYDIDIDNEKNIDSDIINIEELNVVPEVDIEVLERKDSEVVQVKNESSDELELITHIENITSSNNETAETAETGEYQDTTDTTDAASIASEITFNNDEDKVLSKKYKAMNLEKLREECKNNSLSSEGTKSILVTRIIDNIKKQK